jgi:hypothetical protein
MVLISASSSAFNSCQRMLNNMCMTNFTSNRGVEGKIQEEKYLDLHLYCIRIETIILENGAELIYALLQFPPPPPHTHTHTQKLDICSQDIFLLEYTRLKNFKVFKIKIHSIHVT